MIKADQSDRYLDRMKSHLEEQDTKLDEFTEITRGTKQRLESLEQDARQPRLAMEADVPADKKTRERTEGAAAAVQAMHGDSFSGNRVDPEPKSSTSFGDVSIGPLALPCSRDDAVVGNSDAAPKSCLSLLEMRSPTAAGGLLPTDKTSTATRQTTTSLVLPDRRDKFESFSSIRLVLQYFLSTFCPSCRRVI